ncbi:MAG: hypothetical protein ACRDBQ_18685 [Shewanella sp.]
MFGRFQEIVNYHIAQAAGMPPFTYDAIVTVKGKPLTVLNVNGLIESSNFVNDITTITHLTVTVPYSQMRVAGVAAEGDVFVKLIVRTANGRLVGIYKKRGIVVNNRDPNMESPTMFLGESNAKSIALLVLELMDESIWLARVQNVKVRYAETDPLTVSRLILTDALSSNTGAGDVNTINYEEEEQQLYRNIILPDSTQFLDVFDTLQRDFGIYSKGLGVFLYKQAWFIYKLYDEEKFNSAKEKLVVYNLPRERAGQLDRSTHMAGAVAYIITGGDSRTLSKSSENALNHGTGYRVGSLRALDNRTSSFTAGGVSMTTADKYMSQANPESFNGDITNAPVSKERFTDNDKPIRSELSQSQGIMIKVTWNHSVFGLVRPGMAVKFVYANEYGMYSRYGTVIGEVYSAMKDNGAMASDRYNSQTELTLWLGKQKNTV